jgi:serine protease Do
MLMTSTPINRGNSGGPLVTRDGKVVGINTQKIVGQGVEGIGFAVPIHVALRAFEDILGEHLPQ